MLVVVNAASGTLSSAAERDRLRTLFHEAGLPAKFVELNGDVQLETEVESDPADVVVAAGGDGTVNAVAALVVGSGRTLGVIPGGTLNHFARDLGIPPDLDGAVATLRKGATRQVDVAEVNGRLFLNNSSVGMYPEIVREREKIQHRGVRKWIAFIGAVWRTLVRWPVIRVQLQAAGRAATRRTPFVFVGNNRYELEGVHMGSRRRLDGGELCLCVARGTSRLDVARMAVRGFMGGLRDSGELDVVCAREAWIGAGREMDVSLDGEVVRLRPPLHYVARPGALRVIAP